MKQIKAADILSKIQVNTKIIKNDWAIIKTHIDHNTTTTPDYDLHAVLKEIKSLAKERVSYKLMSICVNVGLMSVDQLPKTSSYRTIYELSELEEQHRELYALKTRAKRKGKHIESLLTDDFIDKQIVEISKNIEDYKSQLTKYNESKVLVVNEVA